MQPFCNVVIVVTKLSIVVLPPSSSSPRMKRHVVKQFYLMSLRKFHTKPTNNGDDEKEESKPILTGECASWGVMGSFQGFSKCYTVDHVTSSQSGFEANHVTVFTPQVEKTTKVYVYMYVQCFNLSMSERTYWSLTQRLGTIVIEVSL